MNKIKDIITYLQNLETEQILNVIIALAILIMFLVMSSMISYAILRIFYKKENKEEIKKTHLYKHIRLFINLTGLYISTKLLTLPTEQTAFCDKCYRIVIIWTIVLYTFFEILWKLITHYIVTPKTLKELIDEENILAKALDEVLTPRYSDELRDSYDTGYAVTAEFELKITN